MLLFLRMYVTWNHQTKIAARTTNLDVLSGKEFKSVSQMVLTDSSFRKCKKNLRFSLITANFSFCFKKFPRYFFLLSYDT